MPEDWADKIAQQLLTRGLIQTGICLILGASDTGKTTLTAALAKYLVSQAGKKDRVGIIDADIGQSHIGPPTTVGWALLDSPRVDFSELAVGGISFVGDITPVGHLLQLTAAIVQCVRQVSEAAGLMIIDTPGFISGPAAAALWWTVQQILKPKLILAVRHNDELSDILAGLHALDLQLERIESPPQIRRKSPEDRRSYRQSRFAKYFQDSRLYNISLNDMAIQSGRNLNREGLLSRLVALRDGEGTDVTIGVITDWQKGDNIVVVKAPQLDIRRIRCLVVGNVTLNIAGVQIPDE